MSVPRGMGQNGGHFYSNITQPVKLDLNFVVDSTNGNGLGLRSLKSNGYVRNVFMHTSASPGSNNGYLNPNPLAGYALIQFNNNFNKYLGGFSGFVSPTSGGTSGSTTNHLAYIIAAVGTTTLAQWQAAGLPLGIVPAVGVSFIATATGALGGTGTVIAAGVSGISSVEVIGDPNLSIANSNISQNGGAWLLVQFLGQSLTMASYTPAGTNDGSTPPIFTGTPAVLTGTVSLAPTAPANGSVVGMSAFFNLSSVSVDGL